MAFERRHSATADATFSATGSTNWNANQTPSGADVGGIPYCPTATTETTSANLTYTETSGPRLQVGSGGTSSIGWILGYSGTSTDAAMWPTGLASNTDANAVFRANVSAGTVASVDMGTSNTSLFRYSGGGIQFYSGGALKFEGSGTVGKGIVVTAGTATTDVQALSATQTWNASGVTFTGKKNTFTLTAYHANSLLEDWRSASASLFAIHNTGAFGGVGTTFANAPSAPWTGMIQNFTDSNTATWGATIAGGGANNVLARYNGANWTVVGV